jgi:tetratricopeptide (TPR) repeat protein
MKNVTLMIITVFLTLCLAASCFARISLVIFPFKNLSNDDVYSWISAGLPETAYRVLFTNDEVRLYDPVFIFQTDSSAWEMNSDSLIMQHRKRWQWNAAVGGDYTISRDSVYFYVKVSWSSDANEPVRMEFNGADKISKCRELCFNLLKKVFSLVQVPFPEKETENFARRIFNYSNNAYETYAAGYLFEMKGNIAAASTAYSRALEIEPEFLYAGCRSGRMLYLQQKFDVAKNLYERFLKNYPDDPMISAFMIEALGNSEYLAEAASIASRLKNSVNNSSKGLSAIGYVHLRQGEYHRAISLLSQAKACGPENLDVEFYLGQAMLQSGEYERAIDIFNQLIRYRPDFPKYYSSLGAAYKKSGQLMQASIAMQTALAKNNRDISIMIDLSQIWIDLKWYRKALHILEEAIKINPEIPIIYINKAIALWHTGNIAEAKRMFYTAMKYSSVKQTALVNIGNMYFYTNDYRKALSCYKKASAIEKQNPSLEFDIALSYQKLGKLKNALYHYDQFLALSNDNKDVLYRCADISIELKKFDDAIIYLKRILENTPQEKRAINELSDVYITMGYYDEAVSILDDYLIMSPSCKELVVKLAEVYRTKKWFDVALQKYQEIIRDFPELPDGYLGLGICMMEQVKTGKNSDINNTITALKYAAEKAPADPTPEIFLGDLVFLYEGKKELAVEYWNKALKKITDVNERKKVFKKINSIR